MRTTFAILAAAAGLTACATLPAVAQESGSEVSLAPFADVLGPYVIEVIVILAGALVGWISVKVNKMLGLNIEARHREALQSALVAGATKGLQFASGWGRDATIDVRSELLAEGIRYVQRSVPDAIKHFGLTEDRLREMIEARLPDDGKGGSQ